MAITCHDIPQDVIVTSGPSLLILASLSNGDKHGYAMIEDIEQFTGLRLGPGTLYGAINRLEERGWIKPVRTADRRQPYTLTPAGIAHLKQQLDAMDRILKITGKRLRSV